VNRNARDEKQSASCDPSSKRFDLSADFPPHSAAAGEPPLAVIIYERIGEPGTARRAAFGVIEVIHFRKVPSHKPSKSMTYVVNKPEFANSIAKSIADFWAGLKLTLRVV